MNVIVLAKDLFSKRLCVHVSVSVFLGDVYIRYTHGSKDQDREVCSTLVGTYGVGTEKVVAQESSAYSVT